MNAEDWRKFEKLKAIHARAVEAAQPSTTVSLHVRIDRHGHVCLDQSLVLPQIKVVESGTDVEP